VEPEVEQMEVSTQRKGRFVVSHTEADAKRKGPATTAPAPPKKLKSQVKHNGRGVGVLYRTQRLEGAGA
jgi:hypothetical protein